MSRSHAPELYQHHGHARFITAYGLVCIFTSIIAACGSDPATSIARDDRGFEVDPERIWVAGDLHVHATGASNDAGQESTPAAIQETAIERGLDFVVLTDHSNSTGSDTTTTEEDPALYNQGPEFVYWDRADELSIKDTFIMVSGNEISPVESLLGSASEPRGHIGCIPRSLTDFDTESPFMDRPPGEVTGGSALEQANQRGCFSIIHHPYSVFAPHIRYDWKNMNYDAIEVWNGAGLLESDDMKGYDAWRCDLLAGRSVTPVGSSDNHRVNTPLPGDLRNPALGTPRTAVFAQSFSWPDIIRALDEGYVSIYEGDSRLYLDAYDSQKLRAAGGDIAILRLRGHLDSRSDAPATLKLRQVTECDDPRPQTSPPPTVAETVVETWTIDPGESFDVVVELSNPEGVYTATLMAQEPTFLIEERYSAMSRAIVVP